MDFGWIDVLRADAMRAIMLLVIILRNAFRDYNAKFSNLFQRVRRLEKRRSTYGINGSLIIWLIISWVLILVTAKHTIDVRMTAEKEIKLFKDGEEVVDSTGFKLPSDVCSTGIFISKHCPMVKTMNKLSAIDCGSTHYDFEVRYNRCRTDAKSRVKRSAPTAKPSTGGMGILEEVEFILFKIIRGNTWFGLIAFLCIGLKMRWPVWIMILIGVVTWNAVRADVIEPLYILKQEKMTFLETRMF